MYKSLAAWKPKGLNRLVKIGYGHVGLRDENVSPLGSLIVILLSIFRFGII